MPSKTFAWRKLSKLSCSSSDGKLDDPSYLLTKDHGLHELGLCRHCNNLEWQNMVQWSEYLLEKNQWDILNTQSRCRFCAFVAHTIRGTNQRSLKNIIGGLDVSPNQKLPLRLTLRDSKLDVTLDVFGRSVLLACIELYCEPGTDPTVFAELR